MSCYQEVSKLLLVDKIEEAISVLESHLKNDSDLTEIYSSLISNSAQYQRLKFQSLSGSLSWEQINVSKSKLIYRILTLAKEVDSYFEKISELHETNNLLEYRTFFRKHLNRDNQLRLKLISWLEQELLSLDAMINKINSFYRPNSII